MLGLLGLCQEMVQVLSEVESEELNRTASATTLPSEGLERAVTTNIEPGRKLWLHLCDLPFSGTLSPAVFAGRQNSRRHFSVSLHVPGFLQQGQFVRSILPLLYVEGYLPVTVQHVGRCGVGSALLLPSVQARRLFGPSL